MKQGIIAFLVVLAGCAGIFAVLGLQSPPDTVVSGNSTTTLRVSAKADNGATLTTGALPRSDDDASKLRRTAASDDTTSMVAAADPALDALSPQIAMPVLEPSRTFVAGLNELSRRNSVGAIAWRDRLDAGSTEWKTLTWAIAISGQTAVPSQMIAATRQALPTWPGQAILQQNMEAALYTENPSADLVISEFAGAEPVTIYGAIVLARANFSKGDRAKATAIVRSFWTGKRIDKAGEDLLLQEFGSLLGKADHLRRMAFLLYQGRVDEASRFADMAEAQSLYKAFVAVDRKARNADAAIKAVDGSWRDEPLLLFTRIRQQRQSENYTAAARLLESAPKTAAAQVDPSAWWVEARIVSRMLVEQGNPRRAYTLVASHLATAQDDIVEAEFHAGWYALRRLKDGKAAEAHFKALLAASPRAHDQARALYWLGRTAAAANSKGADGYFRQASNFPATFYGQLAAARIGAMITPGALSPVTEADRIAFANRPEIVAISLLEKGGQESRARRLYQTLAASLERPADIQLLAEKALAEHGPTVALSIGKTALGQGRDAGMAAFPLGAIPETADISGSGKALAYAIARQESAFNPQAVSPANAKGLLQLLPSTAKRVASKYKMAYTEEKLTADPAFNATLGSRYLGEQIDRFDGSLIMTFAAYNAGPRRVDQWVARYGDPRGKSIDAAVDWIESIPFTETREYVQRVMENYQVYKMLLNEKADIVGDIMAGR